MKSSVNYNPNGSQITPQKTTTHAVTVNTRRNLLGTSVLGLLLAGTGPVGGARAVPIPPAPSTGDCTDCLGVVNDTLNACNLNAQSCISTLNDDELHFFAPLEYNNEGSIDQAVETLIDVATGGAYSPGLIEEPFGISKGDAASYIIKGTISVMTNQDLPDRPKAQRIKEAQLIRFDGKLQQKTTTENGNRYVWITFGLDDSGDVENPATVIDCEFLFFKDDNIVNVRAASRAQPDTSLLSKGGEVQLSFTSGVVIERNLARRKVESLRKALGWVLAPVITDFDPRFNPDAPLWFERLFRPFDERNNFKPSGEAYPQN